MTFWQGFQNFANNIRSNLAGTSQPLFQQGQELMQTQVRDTQPQNNMHYSSTGDYLNFIHSDNPINKRLDTVRNALNARMAMATGRPYDPMWLDVDNRMRGNMPYQGGGAYYYKNPPPGLFDVFRNK